MRADAGPPPIQVKAHTRARPVPTTKSAPVSDAAQGYGLKRANAFKKTPQFNRDQQAAATAAVKYQLGKLKQAKQLQPVHHDNFIQSIIHSVYGGGGGGKKSTAAAAHSSVLSLGGPARAATNLGAALVTHPVGTITHTATGITKDALNVPGGLIHAATQSPLTTLKQIGADYAKRYGETDAQMRHRFATQGAAPEVFDALGAYGGVGAAAGRIAKGTDLMSAARPLLRTGGGAAKAQEVSSNLFNAAGQRALDAARAKLTAYRADRASYEEDLRAPAHVVEAQRANEAAGRTAEVTPLHGSGKAQRHGVAVLKSRAVQMLKSEQHRRIEQHARPIINGLNKHERRAFYAVAEGWAPSDPSKFASPAEFQQAVVKHLAQARDTKLATRKAEGIDNVRRNVDEVHKIDQLIKHAHQAFTPKVAQAVRDLRPQDVHVGRNDPGLSAAQRLLRRYGAQAEHLGLRRGEVPAARVLRPRDQVERVPADSQAIGQSEHRIRELEAIQHDAAQAVAAERVHVQHGQELYRQFKADGKDATPIEQRMMDSADRLRHLEADLMAASDALAKARKTHRSIKGESTRVVQKVVPEMHYRQEGVLDFIKRVQAAADKHGLERPLYFPHEADALTNNPDFASRAVGGARAVNAPKRNEYKLFNRGTRDTSPQVYLTGLARSIKRKHNWNLIADQYDRNVLPGLTNMPLGQLKRELVHRGIDPKDVAFWNPGRFRAALKDGAQPAHLKPNRYGDNVTPAEEFGVEHLQHAMTEATHPSTALEQTHGWSAVPKHAHDEIMAAAKPSGKLSRSIDIANGKQSRALLGLNPAWNAFQVMSNVGLGTAATQGRLPLRLIQQQRLYSKLSPEAKDRFDALVGEGAGTHGAQVHLGATAKGRVVGKYRNFKANPFFDKPLLGQHGPTLRQANPLEAGFAFDRFQNKHFRRAVLLDDLKKQAKNLTPPKVESMLHNPAQAERAAEHLNNWLGDYTTYTHAERNGIKKGVLFYGYLRHSLNVLLRTMPRDHPIMTSIIGKLGQLQQDELKKLGLSGLPYANGKFYFTKNGQLQSIDLGRANPVANAVTQIHGPQDALSLLQPVAQIALDQAYHRNSFRDKSWAVLGKSGTATADWPASYFKAGLRARILANQLGELFPPYRIAEKLTETGPQGVDSLPWSQRPTLFTDPGIRNSIAREAAQSSKNALLYQLLPFLPHVSHDLEAAKALKAQDQNRKGSGRGAVSKPKYFTGSGSSGGSFGGSYSAGSGR